MSVITVSSENFKNEVLDSENYSHKLLFSSKKELVFRQAQYLYYSSICIGLYSADNSSSVINLKFSFFFPIN